MHDDTAGLREEVQRLRAENKRLRQQLETLQCLDESSSTQGSLHVVVSSPLSEHQPHSKRRRVAHQADPPALASASSFCPCCRRPVNVDVRHESEVNKGLLKSITSPGPRAYVSLLYGDSASSVAYGLGALALGQSLRASGTKHDLVLMYTSDVPAPVLDMLQQSGYWQLQEVEYLHGSSMLGNMKTWHGIFTKLRVFSLTRYQRVLFLDLDMLVLRCLDELFELQPPAAMLKGWFQPPHGGEIDGAEFFPTEQWNEPHGGINAGVMLLEPEAQVFQRMEREITDQWHPEHIHSYGPEQEYISRFFADRWRHISVKYNFQLFRWSSTNSLRKLDETYSNCESLLQELCAVQFSSYPKPWSFAGPRELVEFDKDRVRATFQAAFDAQWKGTAAGDEQHGKGLNVDLGVELLWHWQNVFGTAWRGLPERFQTMIQNHLEHVTKYTSAESHARSRCKTK